MDFSLFCQMMAIGITDNVNFVELSGIASSDDLVFHVQNFAALSTIEKTIVIAAEEACVYEGKVH